MTSQFDALLSFGDDAPPTTNGTTQNTSEPDEFDPFGPGLSVEGKGGAGDSGLLLDFSVTTEVINKTENGDADPFEAQFTVSTDENSSTNLLYDMSAADAESSSVNPLYDLSATQPTNPLYDLMDEELVPDRQQQHEESHSQNLLYDFSTNNNADFVIETSAQSTNSGSANPLYDLADELQEQQQQQPEEEEEEIQEIVVREVEAAPRSKEFDRRASGGYPDEDQVVPEVVEEEELASPRETTEEGQCQYGDLQEEENFHQHVELYIKEEGDDTVEVAAAGGGVATVDVTDAADNEDADSTKGRRRSRSRTPSRSRSISSEREVLNEVSNSLPALANQLPL